MQSVMAARNCSKVHSRSPSRSASRLGLETARSQTRCAALVIDYAPRAVTYPSVSGGSYWWALKVIFGRSPVDQRARVALHPTNPTVRVSHLASTEFLNALVGKDQERLLGERLQYLVGHDQWIEYFTCTRDRRSGLPWCAITLAAAIQHVGVHSHWTQAADANPLRPVGHRKPFREGNGPV